MFGGGGRRHRGRRRTENMQFNLGVGLKDLYNGKIAKLRVKRKVICTGCAGLVFFISFVFLLSFFFFLSLFVLIVICD